MSKPYGVETERLQFIVERDGLVEAVHFAKTTLENYRKAILHSVKRGHRNPHHASIQDYRLKFIESYLGFKAFLREHQAADECSQVQGS